MKRHIRIGYLGHNKSWEQLLGQIGVSWERLNPDQFIPVESYSCVIADQSLSRTDFSNIETYLQDGGALLDAAGLFYPETVQPATLTTITPESNETQFGHIAEIPIHGQALKIASSGLLDGTVKIDPVPNRHLAFCGLPVDRLWQEYKSIHKSFGTQETATTFERVSALNGHAFFEVILTLLRILHDKSRVPLIHTWWHPDPENHVATIRIDSDYGTLNRMQQLSNSARLLNIPLTWFLHTAHHGHDLPKLIKSLPNNDEVALHCYRHYEYQTTEQYHSDILNGLKRLGKSRVAPKGYAAPYGSWSGPLAEALSRFPFQYTSEFGYDFDSLPSTPNASGILQLPIHPISIGSFRRFNTATNDVQAYFNQIIKVKRLTHQPLHLYHHPNDGDPDQFEELLKSTHISSYHWMTYSEWATWWRRRSAMNCDSTYDTESGQLHVSHPVPDQFPVAIHHNGDYHISILRDTTIHLEELPFRPYIDPDLNTLNRKRPTESGISWFRHKKDQWLTHLWRNRT